MSCSRRGLKWGARRGLLETLERRQLLSGLPTSGGEDDASGGTGHRRAPGAGPTAELVADWRTETGSDSFVFKVVYRDDVAVDVSSLDGRDVRVAGPNGYERRAALIGVDGKDDAAERVARYKVAPPGGTWDAADNGMYSVELRPGEVFDTAGNAAAAGIFGELQVAVAGGPDGGPAVGLFGLDPANFGAYPDDGVDDTAALQAAVDWLPHGNGAPIGSTPSGGVVLLRPGVYDTSGTIWLRSGITLRGAGPESVIRDRGTDAAHYALVLHSPFTHQVNIGVTVERLTLYAAHGGGLAIDPNMNGDVNDLRLANLRMSTAGAAIDLKAQDVYHTDIENVEVYDPGSTALLIAGHSYVNRVRNFSVTGRARSAFRRPRALIDLTFDGLIQGVSVSVVGAKTLPLYLYGRGTLNGVNISTPAEDCPSGVAVGLYKVGFAVMDSLTGIGRGRRLLLNEARDVQIGTLRTDGTSDVLSELVVIDPSSNLRVDNAPNGRVIEGGEAPAGEPGSGLVPPPNVVDARHFGVIAFDELDDSAAIQAAVNSLPRGDGIPGDGDVVGGIVQLPMGLINTSAPISLPSGVWLRGHGNGTTLMNLTLGPTAAVVQLTSPYAHGMNVGAGVVDLGIRSTFAAAIRADHTVTSQVRNLRLAGLRLTNGGPAIDLRYNTVNASELDRVVVFSPGSTALWLGKEDNSSTGNLVRAFRLMGQSPPTFVREKALVVLHGDTRVESGAIEETFAPVVPFYVSGRLTSLDMYMEYPAQPDRVGAIFDGVTGYVDNLWHVDPERKLSFRNGTRLTIAHLNIDGFTTNLPSCIDVDSSSRVVLNTVNTQFDSGMLDDPRVVVKGVYSTRAARFIDTAKARNGNLVQDPTFTNVADDRPAAWTIHWGDEAGAIVGNFGVETVNGERRLRITVFSNPNNRKVSLRGRLNVASWMVGRTAIASWRVDTTAGKPVIGYTKWHNAEYKARVTNTMTAMTSPLPVREAEELWIDLPSAAGTYYVSNVGYAVAS